MTDRRATPALAVDPMAVTARIRVLAGLAMAAPVDAHIDPTPIQHVMAPLGVWSDEPPRAWGRA